jgi:hypothetical protein
LDPSIYETLQKEKVEVGDVIYIEANSGAVKVSWIFSAAYIYNCTRRIFRPQLQFTTSTYAVQE